MFLLGSHLTSFIFIKVFIGILGESVQIQFLAIFYIDLNKGFNQIWHRCFFNYYSIIKVSIGILWRKRRNQVFGSTLFKRIIRDLIKFSNRVCYFYYQGFHWNIRGTLIQNTKYTLIKKNRSPCFFSNRERGFMVNNGYNNG